jgi:hypothetical protein
MTDNVLLWKNVKHHVVIGTFKGATHEAKKKVKCASVNIKGTI